MLVHPPQTCSCKLWAAYRKTRTNKEQKTIASGAYAAVKFALKGSAMPGHEPPHASSLARPHCWQDGSPRDHGLVFNYDLPPDFLTPLDLPKARNRNRETARGQIIASALDHAGSAISHSRRREHYAKRGARYDHPAYGFDAVVGSVDELHAADLLHREIAPADPTTGKQSTFRATPALLEHRLLAPKLAKLKPHQLIRLRDSDKQLIDFNDTVQTSRMQRHLIAINKAVDAVKVELPGLGQLTGNVLLIEGQAFNITATQIYRVFNESFDLGGRFYGPWYQGLPKQVRRDHLMIGGEHVAEPDYPEHHIRILYALEGKPLDEDDTPYEIASRWHRKVVKLAVLILLNAGTYPEALGAIRHNNTIRELMPEYVDANGLLDRRIAEPLIADVKEYHSPIARHFHSGAGRWLMRVDSDMAERIMLALLKSGVVALPMHDSFIVQARHEGLAREQMEKAFETVISKRHAAPQKTVAIQVLSEKPFHNMVEKLSVPRPVAVLLAVPASSRSASLPSSVFVSSPPASLPRQPDPLLSSPPILAAQFFASGKITIFGRRALRDAQRKLGLRQEEVAQLVGISRPQLANVLAGRFGTVPAVADRAAELIHRAAVSPRQYELDLAA